jgi:hypothetical protein
MIFGIIVRLEDKDEYLLTDLFQKIIIIIVIILYKYLEQAMMINEITVLMKMKDTKLMMKNDKNNLAEQARIFEKLDVGLVLIKNNII